MIIEGFICPECQQDMSTADMLRNHFELVHSAGAATKTSQATNGVDELAKRAEISNFPHVLHLHRDKQFVHNIINGFILLFFKLMLTASFARTRPS